MPESSSHQELYQLADYLSDKQNANLEQWKDFMQKEERKASELILKSRKAFYNSIPLFLSHLYDTLRDKPISLEEVSKDHGTNRWEYGFDLGEIIKEWKILHLILTDQINQYRETRPKSFAAILKAQRVLTESIHDGILFSIRRFDQLQKREAEAQLLDLKKAFKGPEEISRPEDLRQTSHDVKGMVHILRTGFFLLEDEKFEGKTKEIIDQMSMAADNLEQLLNDLLDLFRLEAGREKVKITTFKVADVLFKLCESLKPIARAEKLELHCHGDKSLEVTSDLAKIQRIVRNLGLNALKYTQKGSVEIYWERKSEDFWMLRVTDTGPGLSSTHAASLTAESGYSAKEDRIEKVKGHGEGIGLLIVRHLCELLDAIIEVKTDPKTGTTFRIVFPVDISLK